MPTSEENKGEDAGEGRGLGAPGGDGRVAAAVNRAFGVGLIHVGEYEQSLEIDEGAYPRRHLGKVSQAKGPERLKP